MNIYDPSVWLVNLFLASDLCLIKIFLKTGTCFSIATTWLFEQKEQTKKLRNENKKKVIKKNRNKNQKLKKKHNEIKINNKKNNISWGQVK